MQTQKQLLTVTAQLQAKILQVLATSQNEDWNCDCIFSKLMKFFMQIQITYSITFSSELINSSILTVFCCLLGSLKGVPTQRTTLICLLAYSADTKVER